MREHRQAVSKWTTQDNPAYGSSAHIEPRLLGIAALLTTSIAYAPSRIPSMHLVSSTAHLDAFATASLLGACAVALSYIILSPRCKSGTLELLEKAGIAAYVLGTSGFVLSMSIASIPLYVAVVFGIAAGCGAFFAYAAWAKVYARHNLRNALVNVAAAMALSSLLNWLLSVTDERLFLALFTSLTVLSALMPFVGTPALFVHDNAATSREKNAPIPSEARGDAPKQTETHSLRRMASFARTSYDILTAPLLGLFVFGFVGTLVDANDIAERYNAQVIGCLIGTAMLGILACANFRRPLFPFFYQTFFPLLAVLALIMRILASEDMVPSVFFDVGLHVMFGAVIAFSFATLVVIGKTNEYPITHIVAIAYGLYCAAALGGVVFSLIFHADRMILSMIALCSWIGYFTFQALFPTWLTWMKNYPDGKPEGHNHTNSDIRARCDAVALAGGLTLRETEILQYLGRGHNSMYISQTLLISDSTVRTHIKNIYRKLEITSREELISLVDNAQQHDAQQ